MNVASVGHRYRAAPRAAVVSGATNDQSALTHVKVVPGNIHVPEEGRGWVVVCPARLAVVAAAGVNAKMGPAIWVRRIGGLVSAQGAARVAIEPDSKPSPDGLLYRTTGSPKVLAKRTLTAGIGHTGESRATVLGNRQPGDDQWTAVDASGIVVRDQDLVGVIRVGPSECLRLSNVRRGLCPGDQIHVRATIGQGRRQFFHKPGERTGSPTFVGFAASFAWPQKIMMAPARKFSILSMPSWWILEQSKPGGTSGLMYWDLVVTLILGCACEVRGMRGGAPTPVLNGFAAVANWLKASRETPVSATNRPIKTRRLNNADCEVDFFFMSGC